jgi:hypothetical protein
MEIKFFNLNIKHKYHSFDPKMSAAEYWLNDKNAAPIFYGADTCEDILSGRSAIKKKYEKIEYFKDKFAIMTVQVTSDEKLRLS